MNTETILPSSNKWALIFEKIFQQIFHLQIIYIYSMYKKDLALKNL